MFVVHAEDYMRKGMKLPLGRQGENLARYIRYDMRDMIDEFGQGTFEWVNLRSGEVLPYIATNISQVDTFACWNLTNVDTAINGDGQCELRYYVDSVLCKTIVWNTIVTKSLGYTGEVPDPYDDLIDTIAGYANDAQEAANDAEEAAAHLVIDDTLIDDSENAVQNSVIKQNFDFVNTRIDNILTPSGDPTLSELVDVREGADGTVYNSAGAAVRGQINDVNGRVDALISVQGTKLIITI